MKILFIIALTFSFSSHLSAQWFPLSSNTTSHLRSVHFSDKNNGWIAGLDNFLNKTFDGGEIWENTSFHGSSNSAWYSIYVINSDEIYACGNIFIYNKYQQNYTFTTNGGDSWDWQSSWGSQAGIWGHVFFLNSNFGWKVGYKGTGRLSRTITGINGFSDEINLNEQPLSVYFIDQNTGWISGSNGYTANSIDGGNSWNELTSGVTESLYSIFFINSSVGWAAGFKDEIGIIIKTKDGGESWYKVNHPQTLSLHSIQFINENIGWSCGSQVENSEERGVILYTNDGGENWTEQYVCEQFSVLYSLFFIDEFTGWAVGYDGIIVKTTNAGGTSFEGVNEDSYFTRSLNIYPNPFSASTTIEYELKQPGKVTLTIYDYLGKQLEVIIENQPYGLQKVSWNAEKLPDGIYYFRLQAGEQVVNGKIVKAR